MWFIDKYPRHGCGQQRHNMSVTIFCYLRSGLPALDKADKSENKINNDDQPDQVYD